MSEQEIHVDVVMRPEDRTVTGEIRQAGGGSESFAGWIGLLAVLQDITLRDLGANERRGT